MGDVFGNHVTRRKMLNFVHNFTRVYPKKDLGKKKDSRQRCLITYIRQ